jgi:DNA-binding transcriptional LysR family regulator
MLGQSASGGSASVKRVGKRKGRATVHSHEVQDLPKGRTGRLHLGANSHAVEHVLPATIGALLKPAPGLNLKLTIGATDSLVSALRNGQTQLIVRY